MRERETEFFENFKFRFYLKKKIKLKSDLEEEIHPRG